MGANGGRKSRLVFCEREGGFLCEFSIVVSSLIFFPLF